MIKVDLHNYEAYLLDLSEGNLTTKEQLELEIFLAQHPNLNSDVSELADLTLVSDDVIFTGKQKLKKTPIDLISETEYIAYVENELSDKEKIKFEKAIHLNPTLVKQLMHYKNTLAVADLSIVYKNKDKLKRRVAAVWFLNPKTYFAIAASITFLIGLFIFFNAKQLNTLTKLQSNNKPVLIPINEVKTKSIDDKNDLIEDLNRLLKNTNTTNKMHTKSITKTKNQVVIINLQNTDSSLNKIITPLNNDIANNAAVANNTFISKAEQGTNLILNPSVQTKQKTIVEVINESEEEPAVFLNPNAKKGLWAITGNALKKLNTIGIKGVNGNEINDNNKTAYALTLGNINITHKRN